MTYATTYGLDPDGDGWDLVIGDLFADLHHLADAKGVDFFEALTAASVHYNDEVGDPDVPRPGVAGITPERRVEILETVVGRTPSLESVGIPENEDAVWWQHWAALDRFAVEHGMVWEVSPTCGGLWKCRWTSARVDLLGGEECELTHVRTRVFDYNPDGPGSRWWACGRVEDALLLLLELLDRGTGSSGRWRVAPTC